MNDNVNQSRRNPWTNDPEILKEIWGSNTEVPTNPQTASQRIVMPRGSIWPTNEELNAISQNALPQTQDFVRTEIQKSTPISQPMHHTPIMPIIDGMQQLIDDIVTKKEINDDIDNDDTFEDFTSEMGVPRDYAIDDDEMSRKEKISSDKRTKLNDNDFVLSSERKFPVTSPKAVMDAVNSWGRYRGPSTFATFKRNLIELAKRKGFEQSLPKKWLQSKQKSNDATNQSQAIFIPVLNTDITKRMKSAQTRMKEIMRRFK